MYTYTKNIYIFHSSSILGDHMVCLELDKVTFSLPGSKRVGVKGGMLNVHE